QRLEQVRADRRRKDADRALLGLAEHRAIGVHLRLAADTAERDAIGPGRRTDAGELLHLSNRALENPRRGVRLVARRRRIDADGEELFGPKSQVDPGGVTRAGRE